MDRLAVLALFAGVALVASAEARMPAEPYTLRLEVRGVDVWVGISDRRGRPVASQDLESLAVWEDGQPQEIDAVFPAAEIPLSLAIAIDTSSTMTEGGTFDAIVQDLGKFAQSALRSEDRAALYTFRETLTERVPLGAGLDALRAGLKEASENAAKLTFEGTAVRDVLADALGRLAGHQGRRALLLVTDGRDNSSETDSETLAELARLAQVRLYVLLVGRRQVGGHLAALAGQTGGRLLRLREPATLPAKLESIRRELNDHWIVSYRSSHAGDPSCRSLAMAARRGDRPLRVRSPSGYCPSPPSPAGSPWP